MKESNKWNFPPNKSISISHILPQTPNFPTNPSNNQSRAKKNPYTHKSHHPDEKIKPDFQHKLTRQTIRTEKWMQGEQERPKQWVEKQMNLKSGLAQGPLSLPPRSEPPLSSSAQKLWIASSSLPPLLMANFTDQNVAAAASTEPLAPIPTSDSFVFLQSFGFSCSPCIQFSVLVVRLQGFFFGGDWLFDGFVGKIFSVAHRLLCSLFLCFGKLLCGRSIHFQLL